MSVSATHLTLLRDFDPLVIIIGSSIESFQSSIKTLLLQGLSEPEFHGDLVYKFK